MNALSRIAALLLVATFLVIPALAASDEEIHFVMESSDSGKTLATSHTEGHHESHDPHMYISPFTRSRVTEIEDILTYDSFIFDEVEPFESLSDSENSPGVPSPE